MSPSLGGTGAPAPCWYGDPRERGSGGGGPRHPAGGSQHCGGRVRQPDSSPAARVAANARASCRRAIPDLDAALASTVGVRAEAEGYSGGAGEGQDELRPCPKPPFPARGGRVIRALERAGRAAGLPPAARPNAGERRGLPPSANGRKACPFAPTFSTRRPRETAPAGSGPARLEQNGRRPNASRLVSPGGAVARRRRPGPASRAPRRPAGHEPRHPPEELGTGDEEPQQ